jgi:hypothetical protein
MDKGMSHRLSQKYIYGRLQDKSFRTLLLRKLITDYGYEAMPKVAEALIDDILNEIENAYPDKSRIKPGQTSYFAIPVNLKGSKFGRAIKDTDLIPVTLTIFANEDIKALKNEDLKFDDRLKIKIKRLLKEAYAQGAVLSNMDLEALLCAQPGRIQRLVKQINDDEGPLPTRGTIHDLGRTLTHKKQIINLRNQGYLAPEISKKTKHDIKSIDRYLKAYEKVKVLFEETSFNAEKISVLTGLSLSLVNEYIQIVKEDLTGHMS